MAKVGPSLTNNQSQKFGHNLISEEDVQKLKKNKVNFSFEFFRQRDFFGFSQGVDTNWFVGLIERLQEYSTLKKDFFTSEAHNSRGLRYHAIDWNHRNIPVKKTDIDWIPSYYINNQEAYPFVQMAISQANGRIIGFWDETFPTFYVVFLDPLHNMQPAGGKYDHKTKFCSTLSSRYDNLLGKIDNLQRLSERCSFKKQCDLFEKLDTTREDNNIVYVNLDQDFYAEYHEKLSKYPLQELIEFAVLEYNPKPTI